MSTEEWETGFERTKENSSEVDAVEEDLPPGTLLPGLILESESDLLELGDDEG